MTHMDLALLIQLDLLLEILLLPLVLAHPISHLQHGIHKPKVYTDDMIRYGLLASSIEL
jgi:hypothetical protein